MGHCPIVLDVTAVACLRRPHFPVSESGGKGNQGLAPGPLREMAEAVSRTDAREPSALRHPQPQPQKWAAPAFRSGIRDKQTEKTKPLDSAPVQQQRNN